MKWVAVLCVVVSVAAIQGNIYQEPRDFLWLVILAGFVAFNTAFGIGANDVANAFATSVGSGTLTLPQVVVIGGICEFLGAFVLGSHVTDTVRNGIFDPDVFADRPYLIMLGMMCADFASGIWLIIATKLGLPVSTTHSIIGGIIGFAVVAGDGDTVKWKDVGLIVLSWLTAPIAAGFVASSLFLAVRKFILRHPSSYTRCRRFMPALLALTLGVNLFFMMYKGAAQLTQYFEDIPVFAGFFICLALGAIVAAFFQCLAMRRIENAIRRRIGKGDPEHGASSEEHEPLNEIEAEAAPKKNTVWSRLSHAIADKLKEAAANSGDEVDIMHDKAEQFDAATEEMFKVVMVITACFASFAHGANDVANAIAPLAANVAIYTANELETTSPVPLWILALGGGGIVVGLAILGWRIVLTIGFQMTTITPSRGFTMQLSSATAVIVCTLIGIPVSTTHCQVGATLAVGLTEGRRDAVNWGIIYRVMGGWVVTLLFTSIIAGALYAFTAYTPTALAD